MYRSQPAAERPTPAEEAIAKAAAEWLALIDGGSVTARQQHEFKAWLAADPAHVRAFERVRARWESTELVAALADFPLSDPALNRRPRPRRRGWRVAGAWVAAVGLAVAVLERSPAFLPCLTADYCSATGQIRELLLTDGSQVTLDTASAIKVRFDAGQRQVSLLSGQALFAVKPETNRPFRVDSRYCRTEVTGTRFIVAATEGTDRVAVQAGSVQVAPFGGAPLPLKAGDQVVVSGSSSARIEHKTEPEAADWLNGRLMVTDQTLAEVVRRIGRYRRGVIVIGNERLKALRVSGQFDIRNTDHALRALEQTLPLKVRRITPWFVVLS